MTDLREAARGALTVTFDWMALGCERFQAEGASFTRNRSVPRIRDCNQVTDVTASTDAEIDRLLARADEEYEASPHRQFRVDFRTPPAFEARLIAEGYERDEALALVLHAELTGGGPEHEVRLVETEADWQAYAALHALDWGAVGETLPKPPDPEVWRSVGREMVESRRRKTPPVRWWLAYYEGEARAYFGSWEGNEGMGQVEDLFTHPDFRHRGLATALIRHCVADCRAHGAEPVAIFADANDTPQNIYRALGFRLVGVSRAYRKELR
jgi:ribosomal protein S18 acetylase RimI-like enzyme